MNSTVEIPFSLQKKLSEPKSVTLLSRHFSGYQLKVSREKNGRLRGWVTAGETREVKLKGLPTYLTLQKATQLLDQSYLKLQKEAIVIFPKDHGEMKRKCTDSSSALRTNKAKSCEEKVLQVPTPLENDIDSLVDAISDEWKREIVRGAVTMLLKNEQKEKHLDLANKRINATDAQAIETTLKVNHTFQRDDASNLTDAYLLFQRVLSFNNESRDSLFSLTNQSQKLC